MKAKDLIQDLIFHADKEVMFAVYCGKKVLVFSLTNEIRLSPDGKQITIVAEGEYKGKLTEIK